MTDDRNLTDETKAEGRRSLIKKAAVVGGVAWSAPVLLSQPASAQGSGIVSDCTHLFLGSPIGVGCGAIQLLNPNPGQWVVNAYPNGGDTATITEVIVTGGVISEMTGINTDMVII